MIDGTDATFLPSFLRRLADPSIRTVFLAGCGGGFDFVHGMLLYPTLRQMGKSVVIGSYSFGDPDEITGDAPIVFEEGEARVKRVTAASLPWERYAPEVHTCSFLDARYPETKPHALYAYYARDFSVPGLTRLYTQLFEEHQVDAAIIVDGGSDSLMRGDEEGLGDPIEDLVSVTTLAGMKTPALRMLLAVGLGTDRRNHVSDASALRAIAELTSAGGFLGAVAWEPQSPGSRFYGDLVRHLFDRQPFHSVLAGSIVSASEGHFGSAEVPELLRNRVRPGDLFLWPLMPIVWGFDPEKVAERSLIASWIRDLETVRECYLALYENRDRMAGDVRPIEELPRHQDYRGPANPLAPKGDE